MKINQVIKRLAEEETKPVEPSEVKPGTPVMPSAGETAGKPKKVEKVGPEGATIGTGDSTETKEVVPLNKLVPIEKQQGGQPAVAVTPGNEAVEGEQEEDSMKIDELSRMRKLAGMKDENLEEAPAAPNPQATAAAKALDAAIREFQAANGLTVDGIIGPKTQAALNATAGPSKTPANQELNSREMTPAEAEQYRKMVPSTGTPANQELNKRVMTPAEAEQYRKMVPSTGIPAATPNQTVSGISDMAMAGLEHNGNALSESQKISILRDLLTRIDEAPEVNYNPTGLAQVKDAQRAQQKQQAVQPTPAEQQRRAAVAAPSPAAKKLQDAIKQFQSAAGLKAGPWDGTHQAALKNALGTGKSPAAAAPQQLAGPGSAGYDERMTALAQQQQLAQTPAQGDQDLAGQQVAAQSLPNPNQMVGFNQAMGAGNTPVQPTQPAGQADQDLAGQQVAAQQPVRPRPRLRQPAQPQMDYFAQQAARDSQAG